MSDGHAFQIEYLRAIFDNGGTMGDTDDGLTLLRSAVELQQKLFLSLCVKGAGGFVKEENVAVT